MQLHVVGVLPQQLVTLLLRLKISLLRTRVQVKFGTNEITHLKLDTGKHSSL